MFKKGDTVVVVGNGGTRCGAPNHARHNIKMFTAAKVVDGADRLLPPLAGYVTGYVIVEGRPCAECDQAVRIWQVVATDCLRPLLKGCDNGDE